MCLAVTMAKGFLRSESGGPRETVEPKQESLHPEPSDQLLERMADLVKEVTELRAEVTELRAAKPVEGADPEPQEESASDSESRTWEKGFNGASLAKDFDVAMAHLDEACGETDFGREDEPEDELIDEEERKRLELEAFESNPELKDLIAQFNAQDGNSPSSEAAKGPEPESGEQGTEETEMDDQVQSESAALSGDENPAKLADAGVDKAGAVEPSAGPAPQAGDSPEGPSAMSDDEIQARLAEAAEKTPSEDHPADEDSVSDGSPQAEAAAEPRADSTRQAETTGAEAGAADEPVELGFTAFQAGKDIEESEPEEEPVVEPPTVPKIPEREGPSIEFDREVIARVPAHLAVGALAVPVRIENDELICRVAEPFDLEALDRIANALAMKVVPEAAPIEEIVKNLRLAYSAEAAKNARTAVLQAAPAELQRKRSNKKRRKLSRSNRRAA